MCRLAEDIVEPSDRIRNVTSSRVAFANDINRVVSEADGKGISKTGVLPKRSDKAPYINVETAYASQKPGTNQQSASGSVANSHENAGIRGATT
jgi:hypothetical protein